MNKRTKNALIFAATAVVLVGSFFGIKAMQESAEKPTGEAESESEEALLSIDSDFVEAIDISFGGEAFRLEYDVDDARWSCAELPKLTINVLLVNTMLTEITEVESARTLNGDNAEEYGFDEPICEVLIEASEDVRLTFGDTNPVTGYTYMRLDGGEEIYTVDSAICSAFCYKIFDVAEKDEIPGFDVLKSFTNGGLSLDYVEGGSDEYYTDEYEWFAVENGVESPASEEKAEGICEILQSLEWISAVDFAPEDAKLISYGLKNPSLVVNVVFDEINEVDTGETDEDGEAITEESTEEKELYLAFGRKTEGGESYYIKSSLSEMIYTVSAELYESLSTISAEGLLPDDVCLIDWETVDSVDIAIGSKKMTIDIKKELVTDDEGNTDYAYTYYSGDSKLGTADTEAFLDALSTLEAEGTTDMPGEGKETVRVVFHRNTESFGEMVFSLSEYDTSFYIVSFNGYKRLLVNKNSVEELVSLYNAIK